MIRRTRLVSGGAFLAVDQQWMHGGGPAVAFVHATGFCKEVWWPVIDDAAALGAGMAAIVPDQRAHGSSSPGTQNQLSWWQLGSDVLATLGGRGDVIGVGHSSGGASLVMAELLAPGTFSSMLLVEPVIPPPPYERNSDHPLAAGAEKRRPHFATRQEAAERYHGRGAFAGWDERVFGAYLDGGLVPDLTGGFRLACDPTDEAEFYRSADAHGAHERLGELTVPVEIWVGSGSEAFPVEAFASIAERIPQSTLRVVEGSNHFLPMQHPSIVAEGVVAHLRDWAAATRR